MCWKGLKKIDLETRPFAFGLSSLGRATIWDSGNTGLGIVLWEVMCSAHVLSWMTRSGKSISMSVGGSSIN